MKSNNSLFLAINREKNSGFIIDPTIGLEKGIELVENVNSEKCEIYSPTIEYYKEKLNVSKVSVIGLLFRARGTLTKIILEFRKKFKIEKSIEREIVISIFKNSVYILRNHLYSCNNQWCLILFIAIYHFLFLIPLI